MAVGQMKAKRRACRNFEYLYKASSGAGSYATDESDSLGLSEDKLERITNSLVRVFEVQRNIEITSHDESSLSTADPAALDASPEKFSTSLPAITSPSSSIKGPSKR
jgi:hypothetical protein